MGKLIARIRAWLIALVREAVRKEIVSMSNSPELGEWTDMKPIPFADEINILRDMHIKSEKYVIPEWPGAIYPGSIRAGVVPSKVQPDPSFERMQDEALQEQEKYYAEQYIG